MKKYITLLLLSWISSVTYAASEGVHLDSIDIDISNKASLQSGAALFVNYCMGCHSARFSRYERVADDLGIPHEIMMDNLVFGDDKIGELMEIAMPTDLAKTWFGAAPPDLTMVTRVRGADWVYTYLRTFYKDEERPWGVNNLTFPNVGMPHVLLELQGSQECAPVSGSSAEHDEQTSNHECELVLAEEGLMSPEEYDEAMYNLVNFMAYLAEPMALERERIGYYVLLFILFFGVFAYLLNREYWKDIH